MSAHSSKMLAEGEETGSLPRQRRLLVWLVISAGLLLATIRCSRRAKGSKAPSWPFATAHLCPSA